MLRELLVGVVVLSTLALAQTPAPPRVERADDNTTIYAVPLEQAFLAVAQVAASKWYVTFSNKDTATVSFTTKRSNWTGIAHAVTVVCETLPDGRTRVRLNTQLAATSARTLYASTKGLKREFFALLTGRLGTPPK